MSAAPADTLAGMARRRLMTPVRAVAVIAALWAVIYLPWLGTMEIKGEEGRRMLPARTMLAEGDWLTPRIAGQRYYSKPPGINWLIAGSFALTGRVDEWGARAVSAAAMALLAGGLLAWPRRMIDLPGRTVAAAAVLTAQGMMEKGRLIEIEAVYVCLTALAVLAWLDGRSRNRPWRAWLGAATLVALAALVKGPIPHALVFYIPAICVLAYQRRLKELVSPPHLVAIALGLAICLAWAVPALMAAPAEQATETWQQQLAARINPPGISAGVWARDVLLAVVNLMPWGLLLGLLWIPRFTDAIEPAHRPVFRGLRLGAVLTFVLINAMPGAQSRYSLPILPIWMLLIGWVLAKHTRPVVTDALWRWLVLILLPPIAALSIAAAWQWRFVGGFVVAAGTLAAVIALVALTRRARTGTGLALATAGLCAVGMLQYNAFGTRQLVELQKLRPAADRIAALAGADEPIWVYDPGYRQLLWYLREPVRYVLSPEQLPEAGWVLVFDKALSRAEREALDDRLAADRARAHLLLPEHRFKERVVLYEFTAPGPNSATTPAPGR